MKRILIFLAFLVFVQSANAQVDLHAPVSYDVFPIGAMRFPPANILESWLGMNFNWEGFDPRTETVFTTQCKPNNPSSVTPILDPFYWDTTDTTHTYSDLYSLLEEAAYAQDIRIYMPGTSGITQEYVYKWDNNTGEKVSGKDEWFFTTTGVSSGDYVLNNLDGSAQNDPYQTDHYVLQYLRKDHVNTFSYDFIFYFEQNDLNLISGSTPLYSVEYWIKPPGSNTYNLLAADTITKSKYNSLSIAKTQAHSGDSVGAENLYSWSQQQFTASPQRFYKLLHRTLNLRDSFVYSGNDAIASPQVDVRVKTFDQIPMYVRGLRIRDWRAQRLLGGYADAAMTSAIAQLLTHPSNPQFKSWTIGNENTYRAFHAWAYIDNLLLHNGAPPANILSPVWSGPELFNRVLRDQLQWDIPKIKTTSVVWDEQSVFGGVGYRSRYVNGIGIPVNYISGEHHPRAIPSAMSTDSVALWERGVRVMGNYDQFTRHIQDTVFGFSSEANGGGIGQDYKYDYQHVLEVAKSSYELDPSHPSPYFLMAQTLVKHISLPKWEIDSLQRLHQIAIRAGYSGPHITDTNYWADTANGRWADSLYNAKIISPYLAREHARDIAAGHDTLSIEEDSLFDVIYANRNPTPAEFTYQLWKGVLMGMKGYAINLAYSDGLEQFGFLKDTVDRLLRSYEIMNFQVKQPRLETPYRFLYKYGVQDYNYSRSLNVLPGYKNLFDEARNLITEDLGPIAKTLSVLNWKGTVSWHKRDSCPTYLSKIPLKNLHSKSVAGSIDSSDQTYVQLSIFQHPSDSTAKYVAIQNRRLWCNEDNNDSTDYRIISFQIDSTVFNPSTYNIRLWKITDVGGKVTERVVSVLDTFSFQVKPGQGKLFRIAPAIGLSTGTMAENIYNNARHICAIEDTGAIKYAATYQNNGDVYVTYPVETPGGMSKRILATPSDSLVVHDFGFGEVRYPAIAYSLGKYIGIAYQINRPHLNPLLDSVEIWIRVAPLSDKYNFTNSQLISAFTAVKGFVAAPAIAASQTTTRPFWVGWTSNGSGVVLQQIGQVSGTTLNLSVMTTPVYHFSTIAAHAKFISLATHNTIDRINDTVYVAFEESNQIFFAKTYKTGPTVFKTTPKKLSNGNCNSHYPQIAITKLGEVGVVWEAHSTEFYSQKTGTPGTGVKIVTYRQAETQSKMRSATGSWYNLYGFVSAKAPLSDHINFDTLPVFPNIALATRNTSNSTWWDSIRVTWSNPIDNVIGMARATNVPKTRWLKYNLIEPSLEPAMPITSKADTIEQPLLFRAPVSDADGKNVRITQYDFPVTNVAPITSQTSAVMASNNDCDMIAVNFGGGSLAKTTPHTDTIVLGPNLGAVVPPAPSDDVILWNTPSSMRSEALAFDAGDTLRYQRMFRVGMYEAGDTTAVSNYLTDSTDYIKMRIMLRDQITDLPVLVLDSAVITKAGFSQTMDIRFDTGYKELIIPSNLGNCYLSIDATRGDPANGFELTAATTYESGPIDAWPPPEPLEKRSQPSPSNASKAEPISVSVIPNPFHTNTTVTADVSKGIYLNVSIFDVLGRKVTELVNTTADRSHYELTVSNEMLSDGTYYLRIQSGSQIATRKIELVR